MDENQFEELETFNQGANFESNSYLLGFLDAISLVWYNFTDLKTDPQALTKIEEKIKLIHVAAVKKRYRKIENFIEEVAVN